MGRPFVTAPQKATVRASSVPGAWYVLCQVRYCPMSKGPLKANTLSQCHCHCQCQYPGTRFMVPGYPGT
eukprot:753877-Rhodomonas_salina.1